MNGVSSVPNEVVDVVDAKPKKTKAEREAARAARKAAKPVREHPKKGKPKPKAGKGGKLRPGAKTEPSEAVRVDGCITFSKLDVEAGVSEWIILEADDQIATPQ